ncbi:LOW QUALITY PROTEIN: Lipoxygenase, C-terminal [Dillenia turbinata]|uniref:Lipoxygenase, C-terminal n=1 Tax=Dillenia turbinata TaxID=194707 RepID=A0AAN8UNP9_9MAGN
MGPVCSRSGTDYAYYNDLGSPDKGKDHARPVLGGSNDYPYPRRGRTSRAPNKKDPKTENRLPLLSLDIYVPRDERFGHLKMPDFLAHALESLAIMVPELKSLCDKTPDEFDTFQDVLNIYEGRIKLPQGTTIKKVRDCIPWEIIKELVRTDGERFLKFPLPDVIKCNYLLYNCRDKFARRTDEEFTR